ncbi:hypothetical protein GcC1_031026 [Golovinomyces cichoracearum]|uniref:Uncharacterized protein n=1 Tax=Golovinomyces cichoracearum TaxID=62708 RepID=A0A420J292_9PEZI|nr:hypothetical protein GcC1_031026 [Golovinomyces cichoracearum]
MVDSKVDTVEDAAASFGDGSDTGAGGGIGVGVEAGGEANVGVGAGAGRTSTTISSYTLVFGLSLYLLGRPLFFAAAIG